jgi:hypothetical protein
MKRMLPAAALFGVISSASGANAACIQANVAGDWTSYEVYAGGGETGSEVTCQLKIDDKGEIDAASSCKEGITKLGSATGSVVLTSGGRCAYKVTISQAIRRDDFALDATLSLNRFMSGAGFHGGTTVEFNMIKIK